MTEAAFSYISFGPTCVPAEILKAAGLRRCTFGFDWFRSGSFFIERFLSCPIDEFLVSYVYNPCIPLLQSVDPATVLLNTSELHHNQPCYGFPYLYNPHRSLQSQLTREYFRRSFVRLHQVLSDPRVFKIVFLADYINKPYGSLIQDPVQAIEHVDSQLSGAGIRNYSVVVLRIEIKQEFFVHNTLFDCNLISSSLTVGQTDDGHLNQLFFAKIGPCLDELENRDSMYRILAKQLFDASSRCTRLWSPAIHSVQ